MTTACRISELIANLQQHQQDDFVLCSLWYEDDVMAVDPSTTAEEARAVLRLAAKQHDATQGITWEALENVLDTIRN